jgi:hypothetical protein
MGSYWDVLFPVSDHKIQAEIRLVLVYSENCYGL